MSMLRGAGLLWLRVTLVACSACATARLERNEGASAARATAASTPLGPAGVETAGARPSSRTQAIDSVSAPAVPGAVAAPELSALLTGRGVRGVVALLEGESSVARCSDAALCAEAFVPASTFKIANSIIGLETGVIADADFVIPWDGEKRPIEAWNRDHTLRTAIRDSVVPYYQELARRVGPESMQRWLDRLHYGDRQIGDRIDRFWLEGPLRITPLEQLGFLRRLERGRLPIKPRTQAIVLDIIVRGELDGQALRGKTGWAEPGTPREVGWFVGSWDGPQGPRYVAVVVLAPPESFDMATQRQAIAEAALRSR